jgi:hypothetical protein
MRDDSRTPMLEATRLTRAGRIGDAMAQLRRTLDSPMPEAAAARQLLAYTRGAAEVVRRHRSVAGPDHSVIFSRPRLRIEIRTIRRSLIR